jgi:hypothetical protein
MQFKKAKIKSIKKIGVRDCYDITIPKYHNFFLANGILTHNCNYLFASQDILSIPERVVKQCSHIFLPYNVEYHILKDAMRIANIEVAEVKSTQYNEMRRITSNMRRFDWLVIDMNEKIYTPIRPLSPLTNVKETE